MIGVGLVVLACEILWLVYLYASNNFSEATLFVAVIPVFIGFDFYTLIKNKIEDAFSQQFAIANGFSFQKKGLPADLDGSLFSIGHSPSGRFYGKERLNSDRGVQSLCQR